jgi:dihydrofolate synthase/folylpolyglutamate synthase
MTLGLGNIRRLLDAIGNPHTRFESVVIAGTNGKGSVSAYLASILKTNGRVVGFYSSPHVYSVNERICIDGEPAAIDDMERAASTIAPLHGDIGFSYFEALTAIAYQLFAEKGIDIAVLETGLGGRFDATNVVDPRLSVLTGIALDHRRILGDTEEEILMEKLGITRPGVPLVCGGLSPGLRSIVESKAARDGILLPAPGSITPTHMSLDGMKARIVTAERDYGDVDLPFIGSHQLGNALVAVRAAELVLGAAVRLDTAARQVRMPGRFEVLGIAGKKLVFDVAHNDQSLIAAATTLASLSPREENGIILGIMRRKELREFVPELWKAARYIWLVNPLSGESDEGSPPAELLARVGVENLAGRGLDTVLAPMLGGAESWKELFDRVLDPSHPAKVVLVTGSHRTVEVCGRELHRLGLY